MKSILQQLQPLCFYIVLIGCLSTNFTISGFFLTDVDANPISRSLRNNNEKYQRPFAALSVILLPCGGYRAKWKQNQSEQDDCDIKKRPDVSHSSMASSTDYKLEEVKRQIILDLAMVLYRHNKKAFLKLVVVLFRPTNINKGRILLTIVALLYGSLNVTLRQLYALPGPPSASALSFIRGWLTVAAFFAIKKVLHFNNQNNQKHYQSVDGSCVIQPDIKTKSAPQISKATLPIFWGTVLELSVWGFASTALASIGLLYTESSRASFLTQTSVLITPLISVMTGQTIGKSLWLGCGLVLSGLLLISASTVSSGTASSEFTRSGDVYLLGGAFCWSMYLFRMSQIQSEMIPDVNLLLAWKVVCVALLRSSWFLYSLVAKRCEVGSWIKAMHTLWAGCRDWKAWALLILSAIGPGAIAELLQQQGQKEVSATEANVLLSSEPIFAAILGYFILGESMSAWETSGGALIVLGAFMAARYESPMQPAI